LRDRVGALKAPKPAIAQHDEPASMIDERLGGRLDNFNTRNTKKLQVKSLTRRCAISAAAAIVVASLCYGEAQP
jgi:hypothetical protein